MVNKWLEEKSRRDFEGIQARPVTSNYYSSDPESNSAALTNNYSKKLNVLKKISVHGSTKSFIAILMEITIPTL